MPRFSPAFAIPGPGRFVSRPGIDTTPVVTSITPDLGPITGGTAVTIVGSNFKADSDGNPPTVTIGGVPATSVVLVDSQTLTCVTGAVGAALLADVLVICGTQTGTYADSYWYTPADTPVVIATVNGVAVGLRLDASIRDALKVPSTASFVVNGPEPAEGAFFEVAVTGVIKPYFRGTIQTVTQLYEDIPGNPCWQITASSEVLRDRRRPFDTFTAQSITNIVQSLVSNFAVGYTANHVQAGLQTLSITFNGTQSLLACLKELAVKGGCFFYWDRDDLHFFQNETPAEVPESLDTSSVYLRLNPPVTQTKDDSQLRTRVFVRGAGSKVLVAVGVNATVIPIEDASYFNASGGQAISGSQRLAYTSTLVGGAATTVAGDSLIPGTPSAAVPGTQVTGALKTSVVGSYQYAVAFSVGGNTGAVGSASGSVGSPSVTATGGSATGSATGGAIPAGTYFYYWTTVTARGESASLASQSVTLAGATSSVNIVNMTYSDARIIRINLYRSKVGTSSPAYLVAGLVGSGAAYVDTKLDTDLDGQTVPSTDSCQGGALSVSGIPTSSDSRVTGRVLYRTTAGGSTLFQCAVLGDNTTTTFVDTVADEALGAVAPSVSTIGIPAGRTSLILTSGTGFPTTGGWAQLGSLLIRYTSRSGNTLSGIPSSGDGSLSVAVASGDPVVVSSLLLGVTGVSAVLNVGNAINLWVQRDDLVAQNALALVELDMAGSVTDGVHEYIVNDDSIKSDADAIAIGDAHLALYSTSVKTLRYTTLDPNARAGRLVHVNLPIEVYSGDFMIQDVSISLWEAQRTYPLKKVVACNVWQTVEDLLLKIK